MAVSIREFKAHLSRYLAEARKGRPIEVTSHRRVVARVIGVPDDTSMGLETLIATGEAEWGGGKPCGGETRLSAGGKPVSRLALEDRG